MSIRLPAETKAKLQALSLVKARPQWRVISEAIDCYIRARSEHERAMIDDLMRPANRRGGRLAHRDKG